MRVLLLAIAVCGAFACARLNDPHSGPDHFFVPLLPQLGYAIKRVIGKEAPITLVAHDGSVCRTSRERYANTDEGRWIVCIWNLPSLDSTEPHRSGQQSGPQLATAESPILR